MLADKPAKNIGPLREREKSKLGCQRVFCLYLFSCLRSVSELVFGLGDRLSAPKLSQSFVNRVTRVGGKKREKWRWLFRWKGRTIGFTFWPVNIILHQVAAAGQAITHTTTHAIFFFLKKPTIFWEGEEKCASRVQTVFCGIKLLLQMSMVQKITSVHGKKEVITDPLHKVYWAILVYLFLF